jgi:hypothetical protein
MKGKSNTMKARFEEPKIDFINLSGADIICSSCEEKSTSLCDEFEP